MTRPLQPRHAWNRRLWGVQFVSRRDPGYLILGEAWAGLHQSRPGAPTRALLFTTRRQAREWCRDQQARVGDRMGWKFRPIRVVEKVTRV